MPAVTRLRCRCGLIHRDESRLAKVGWWDLGSGEFARLAKCPCGETLAGARITDARKCDACKRLVTGTGGDVKVCVIDEHVPLVLCVGCFVRHPRRVQWLAWTALERGAARADASA